MKVPGIIMAAVFAIALLAAPVYAENPCATNPCAENPCAAKKDYWGKHQMMKKEHLGMLKDLMVIVRDLNHKPTAAEKEKINGMIKKLDTMIEQCDTDMKRMKKKDGKGMKHGM